MFPERKFVITARCIGAFVIAWCISCVISVLFSCIPVYAFWNPSVPAKCIDSAKFFIGNAIPNIFTDTFILILPIRSVWKLQISRGRRLAVSGLFLLGSLYVVSSSVTSVLLPDLLTPQ